jgi:type II secretory pathway component GspD/PulD (secretin)
MRPADAYRLNAGGLLSFLALLSILLTSQVASGVPLLGNIPLVGGLFRSASTSDKQSKLYVFVKAEIIRPASHGTQRLEDLEKISERDREAFEQHEAQFQGQENWPGIKPKPMPPAKVLDAR